jgi:hypothetical protein
MRNQNVQLIPGCTPYREGPVDQKEFDHLLRLRRKRLFSLDRTQAGILALIVLPYWQNYLSAIAHPFDEAYIASLGSSWVDDAKPDDPKIVRVAHVIMDSYVSLDVFPEKILFQVELCNRNVPHRCLVIHEGRGRFEVSFRNQGCDGIPH